MTVPSVNEVRALVQKHTENLYHDAVVVFGHHGTDMTNGDLLTLKAGQDALVQGLMVRYQRRADEERKAQAQEEERAKLLAQTGQGPQP